MASQIFSSYISAYEFAKRTGGIIQVITSVDGKKWKVYYCITRSKIR